MTCLSAPALPLPESIPGAPAIYYRQPGYRSSPRQNHPSESLSFWQVNVPRYARESTCPDFLRDCSEKDRGIIATPDSEYRRLLWPTVKRVVETRHTELFSRVPSELRAYKQYLAEVNRRYGSIMNFILEERLQWGGEGGVVATGKPFEEPSDFKIIYNDWPYGIDRHVTHLVVWTKFFLSEDPTAGRLAKTMRESIERFIENVFCDESNGGVKRKDLVWFWNPVGLKTVHAVEHFHVLLHGAEREFLDRITGGDVPMALRIKRTEGKTRR